MTIERCYITAKDVERLQGNSTPFGGLSVADALLCKKIGRKYFWEIQHGHSAERFNADETYRLCHDYKIPEELSIYSFLKRNSVIFAALPEDARELLQKIGKHNCFIYTDEGWVDGEHFGNCNFFNHQACRLKPEYEPVKESKTIIVRDVMESNGRYVVNMEMESSLDSPSLHGVLLLHEIFSHKAFAGIRSENPFTGELMDWSITRSLCSDPKCPSNLEAAMPSIPRKVRFTIK